MNGMNKLLLPAFSILLLAIQALAQQQECTPNELAATYAAGHNFWGSFLTLTADGQYSKRSYDCTTQYFESGTYAISDGVLHFTVFKRTAKPNGGELETDLLAQEFPKEYKLLPIKWSDRIYLVFDDDLSNFANAINLGLEPRSQVNSEPYYGAFYLRTGDENKKVRGNPTLSGKWTSFLLSRPVSATVIYVEGEAKDRIGIIDKGSKNGLKVEMHLLAKDEEPSLWSRAEIVSVEEDSAKVRLSYDVKIGDQLSTKYKRSDGW